MTTKPIAVMISGNGSNLQALIDHNIDIALVISSNPKAFGLSRAKQANIPTAVLEARQFNSPEEQDDYLLEQLAKFNIQLIVLAGYMRILGNKIIKQYYPHIINTHPSLLPKYPGLDTYQRALDAKDTEHGCTIHLVNEELDSGPIIAQVAFPIGDEDDKSSLKNKTQHIEHKLYPKVVQMLLNDELKITAQGILHQNQKLPLHGLAIHLKDL